MTKVLCNYFECPHRDNKTGECMADEIFRDGRFCSGFEKEYDIVTPVYGEKGFEGYIRTIGVAPLSEKSVSVVCPSCKNEASVLDLNYYCCKNKKCEVQTFRISMTGIPYQIKYGKSKTKTVANRSQLNKIYEGKLPYHEYPEKEDEKK